ncbi:MAG: radical SAM/SPASM domain-containing protein [Thermodesulforhabdaceae bacterium]
MGNSRVRLNMKSKIFNQIKHFLEKWAKTGDAEKDVISSPILTPMPQMVYLELTNHCNLRCIMCTFHSPFSPCLVDGKPPRKKGFMKKELAFKIIDELGLSEQPITVALHGAGEPLLYKEVPEVVARANCYPNLNIGFLTNAMLLTPEISRKLIESGLKWVSFSIDGNSPDLFERYRKGADLETVLKNAMNFLEITKEIGTGIVTHVNMTVQEEMWQQVDDFVDFWLPLVDRVSISPCRPMGSRRSPLVTPEAQRIPCPMLFFMMVIYWDGKVGLCCEDWFNEGCMGDVEKEGVAGVWRGKRFQWARQMHKKKLYHKVPLCGDCDIWFNGTPEISRDEFRKCTVTKNAWQWEYRKDAL